MHARARLTQEILLRSVGRAGARLKERPETVGDIEAAKPNVR